MKDYFIDYFRINQSLLHMYFSLNVNFNKLTSFDNNIELIIVEIELIIIKICNSKPSTKTRKMKGGTGTTLDTIMISCDFITVCRCLKLLMLLL